MALQQRIWRRYAKRGSSPVVRKLENPATEPGVEAFIASYHIDSEIGMRFFADTIKKHGLDKNPEGVE